MGAEQGRVRQARVNAICFVGWSGSGKTTLIERLIPVLNGRVGYLKGHRGEFTMDQEGKDTDRIFKAGAASAAIASQSEGALRFRLEERDPYALLERHFMDCDFVLVEGFKSCDLPKIEVASEKPIEADGIIAVVADAPEPRGLPRFGRTEIEPLARFVEKSLLS